MLSKADLPMIGDLITADGFDATGTVNGKGPINGLARVALSNTDQLTAMFPPRNCSGKQLRTPHPPAEKPQLG